jgi:molecular chaperone GrpE
MNPEHNYDNLQENFNEAVDSSMDAVDDFIKQLEEKERDLHITAETSIIEIAESFDDANLPDFLSNSLANTKAKELKPEKSNPEEIEQLKREIDKFKAEANRLRAERDELLESSKRRSKDFEALRNRTERERRETFQNQISNLAIEMLPALDNLHRALDSAAALEADKDTSFQHFYDGIVLVSQQITEILGKMGISPIPTVGMEFDPNIHEAIAVEPREDVPPNHVFEEVLTGYVAGERVIRHALVKVSSKA